MTNLSEIIRERSTPGILIFDRSGLLLYSNSQASEMLAAMHTEEGSSVSAAEEIFSLCAPNGAAADTPEGKGWVERGYPILTAAGGLRCSLRSFLIDDHGKGNPESHLLVLIEKVVEQRRVDTERARREFSLTRREGEVVGLICRGFTNREISENMFISEYTVKVHIRNIMKKMKAGTRNEIFALLK